MNIFYGKVEMLGKKMNENQISNTILECYPEQEGGALKDKLIELKWEGVNEYLYALDRF